MGEMTIANIDDALLHDLTKAASRVGCDPVTLAHDMIAYQLAAGPRADVVERLTIDTLPVEQRESRAKLIAELSDTRAMTLKPLAFDSTLLIREIRDADD